MRILFALAAIGLVGCVLAETENMRSAAENCAEMCHDQHVRVESFCIVRGHPSCVCVDGGEYP